MKKMAIILLFLSNHIVFTATAQTLTFYSAEFESGVKAHLGLSEDENVLQSLADTITSINLSGLGITDIRDVVYLPQVKELNLSNNGIVDIFALTVLDSLRLLNLNNNEIESISPLVFSNSDRLLVLIAYNHISDFSYFYTPAKCQVTLIGSEMQQDTDILLGDVNGEGRVDEVDAQQILDVSAGVKSLGELTVPEAVGVPGGSSNALEVNAQKVLDYSVAGDKPW